MKKTVRSNYRVEAFAPTCLRPDDHDGHMWAAGELARQISRHCDTHVVVVKFDSKDVCEFCGYAWEPGWDTDPDGPACCSKAFDEFEASKAAKP